MWQKEQDDFEKKVDAIRSDEMIWELSLMKEEASEIEIIEKLKNWKRGSNSKIPNIGLSNEDFEASLKRVSTRSRLVAAITFQMIHESKNVFSKIWFLGVRYKFRGQGIATQLIEYIKDRRRFGNFDKMIAYVISESSIPFWKKLQFT